MTSAATNLKIASGRGFQARRPVARGLGIVTRQIRCSTSTRACHYLVLRGSRERASGRAEGAAQLSGAPLRVSLGLAPGRPGGASALSFSDWRRTLGPAAIRIPDKPERLFAAHGREDGPQETGHVDDDGLEILGPVVEPVLPQEALPSSVARWIARARPSERSSRRGETPRAGTGTAPSRTTGRVH